MTAFLSETGALAVSCPRIRELIQAFVKQRQQHNTITAELEAADAEVREAAGEVRRLKARIEEREVELARSGAVPPEEPFAEEIQLGRAERQERIFGLRANIPRDQLQASQSEIDRLNAELDAAWLEFGKDEHQKALSRFREVALAVREAFGDILVLATVFPSLSLRVPEVGLGDASCS